MQVLSVSGLLGCPILSTNHKKGRYDKTEFTERRNWQMILQIDAQGAEHLSKRMVEY